MNIRLNEGLTGLGNKYLFLYIKEKAAEYGARGGDELIDMSVGDAVLPICKSAIEAMERASRELGRKESFRGYPPAEGYGFLREAVSAYYTGLGAGVRAEDVFISDGAKGDFGYINELFSGNELLIPDPAYPVYAETARIMNIKTKRVNISGGRLISPSGIERKPYVICLCSPDNPTGAAFNERELYEWAEFALDTGSVIIYDASYSAYCGEGCPRTVYSVPGAAYCAVELNSLSKSAGFTGVRCSWIVVPGELRAGNASLRELFMRRQSCRFNGVSYITQRGAEAALSPSGLAESFESVAYYKRNARMVADALNKAGAVFSGGTDSPYIWLRRFNGADSDGFFTSLMREARIISTPGTGFGGGGRGYVRLSAFVTEENAVKASERLTEFLK